MIPALDSRGFLPPGIHSGTLDEIRTAFATNPAREALFTRFQLFLARQLRPVADGLDLFVGGSFISDKRLPGDIDCTVQVSCLELGGRIGLMNLMNDGRNGVSTKGVIWDMWKVDLVLSISAPGFGDLTQFFQYVGHKSASLKSLNDKDLRGIVKVIGWTTG